MKVLRVLRNGTRNQSTADYSRYNVFVFGNRYYDTTVINKDAVDIVMEEGILVKRDSADPTRVEPIILTADLSKVIGITATRGEVTMAQNDTLAINYAHSGDIDGSLLRLPEASTLNTMVGDETLKDLLTSRGFHILEVTENSKFDN